MIYRIEVDAKKWEFVEEVEDWMVTGYRFAR